MQAALTVCLLYIDNRSNFIILLNDNICLFKTDA